MQPKLRAMMTYKDSGVEWLGEVPAALVRNRSRTLRFLREESLTHRPRNIHKCMTENIHLFKLVIVARANKYVKNYKQTLSDKGTEVSKKFRKGTLLMAIAANIGDVAILDFDSYLPDSIIGYKPKKRTPIICFIFSPLQNLN